MEDDLQNFKMEDDLKNQNGRRPQKFQNRRRPQKFQNRRRPQKFQNGRRPKKIKNGRRTQKLVSNYAQSNKYCENITHSSGLKYLYQFEHTINKVSTLHILNLQHPSPAINEDFTIS